MELRRLDFQPAWVQPRDQVISWLPQGLVLQAMIRLE